MELLQWKGRLSVSVTILLFSSIAIRFLGLACVGIAFYMKYGDDLIKDSILPALNSIEIHDIPLGSYIQGLAFATVGVFVFEFVTGIISLIAGVKKKEGLLILYVCLCLTGVLIYIVYIILWNLLYHFVLNKLAKEFEIYYERYISTNTILYNGYQEYWRILYQDLECCGSNGTNYCLGAGTFPGCYDVYSAKITTYIQMYIGLLVVCLVCQILNIVAADYTIIKLQLKQNDKNSISTMDSSILCMTHNGILPKFWSFLKELKKRTPHCLVSVIIKLVNLVSSLCLVITSVCFISSSFVSHSLTELFEAIQVFEYNTHNIMTGFSCSVLVLGCLGVANSVLGLLGSRKQSTLIQTCVFISSIFLAFLMTLAGIFWIILLNKIYRNIYDQINGLVDKPTLINTLMLQFDCCVVNSITVQRFCYSDAHESVTDLGANYATGNVNYGGSSYTGYSFTVGLYGTNDTLTCSEAIKNRLGLFSGFWYTFLIFCIICDVLGPVFISNEFKENQSISNASDRSEIKDDGKHLMPWLKYLFFKDRSRNLIVLLYIILTVFMVMLELSFIVIASIFSISYHVNRDYIDSIGDLYKFLAISSVALSTCFLMVRVAGLLAVFKKWRKVFIVTTVITVINVILTLTYVIMATVLRIDEYPCSYHISYSLNVKDCSSSLEATSGVAIGMFVIELAAQISALVLHDRSYLYIDTVRNYEETANQHKQQKGLFKTLYHFLFVDSVFFNNSPNLQVPVVIYVITSFIMLLTEITFIVLVCFYGLDWLLDRSWITSGLYDMYDSTIQLGLLFDFLSIAFLVLIPIITINRGLGIFSILTSRQKILSVNTAVMIFTVVLTVIFLALTVVLLGNLKYCKMGVMSCPYRRYYIVGVPVAVLSVELIVQIVSFLLNDKAYKYFKTDERASETGDKEIKVQRGLFRMMVAKAVLERSFVTENTFMKIPVVIAFFTTIVWLVIEILFWVGTILEIGSPRFVNDDLMHVLYDKSMDGINLGHLANGLGYTAIGLIPIIVAVRILGLVMLFKQSNPFIIVTVTVSILFCLGCSTLFGLSTYHMQFVYNCFGSTDQACTVATSGKLLNITAVYLTFFLIETVLHILQTVLFCYLLKVLLKTKVSTLHIFDVSRGPKRVMKFVHIVMRLTDMVVSFAMLIAIIFWLSEIHIMSASFKTKLTNSSFYDTNLNNVAKGLVITSIVTITIIIVNNIVTIIATINGMYRTLITNVVVLIICIITESVSLGLQCVIEYRMTDPSISVYVSYTVLQIVVKVVYITISVIHIKEKNNTRIGDSSTVLIDSKRKMSKPRTNVTETVFDADFEVEESLQL